MEVEVAKVLSDILVYCKAEWYPEFTMVKYCVEENSKGLDFYVSFVEAVKEALAK